MVQIIKPGDRDHTTAQTPGMSREAGVCADLTGAQGLWMGVGHNEPGAHSGTHHHGESESGIYVLSGRMRFRWGEHLEHVADAEAGDFIFVPPWVPHQEANASKDETLKCVIVRSQPTTPGDAVIVNLPGLAPIDLGVAEWVDSVHPRGHTYADGGHAHEHGHGHAHGHGPAGPSP